MEPGHDLRRRPDEARDDLKLLTEILSFDPSPERSDRSWQRVLSGPARLERALRRGVSLDGVILSEERVEGSRANSKDCRKLFPVRLPVRGRFAGSRPMDFAGEKPDPGDLSLSLIAGRNVNPVPSFVFPDVRAKKVGREAFPSPKPVEMPSFLSDPPTPGKVLALTFFRQNLRPKPAWNRYPASMVSAMRRSVPECGTNGRMSLPFHSKPADEKRSARRRRKRDQGGGMAAGCALGREFPPAPWAQPRGRRQSLTNSPQCPPRGKGKSGERGSNFRLRRT